MTRLFSHIIDVRKGEVTLTLLMLCQYFLLLVTYYFLKPARDSHFLIKEGSGQLPLVYMMIAVMVTPLTTLYARASRRLKLYGSINLTTLMFVVSFLVLRWLLEFPNPVVSYAFYVWVSVFGAMSLAQFWQLANGVFDAAQAKRLFVLFSLGGILGAFVGGEITGVLTANVGVSTENLLFFCVGLLVVSIIIVQCVWMQKRREVEPARSTRRREQPKERIGDVFRTITGSRHLLLISGIIAVAMATGTFVDYQFKAVAEEFVPKAELTPFFGKFYGRLSLLSLLFQLFISYRLLRVVGVGGAILLLPLALLGGTVTMLLVPGLVAGVLLRGAGGVFEYSIDKTGRELLFLPLSPDVKKRTKLFIDVFADRWFRGLAGAALLILISVFHVGVRELSFIVLALLAFWLATTLLMRKEYVNSFRSALERREIDLRDLRINIAESETLKSLQQALESTNERQICYALEMLVGVQDSEIAGAVKPLMWHTSNEVRLNALRVLTSQDSAEFNADVEKLLDDRDPAVRLEAMNYTCKHGAGDPVETLRRYLHHESVAVRSAALGCLTEYGDAEQGGLLDESVIKDLLKEEGPEGEFARRQVAEALGAVNRAEFRPYILQLFQDPSPAVVASAMRSGARIGDLDFVPLLIGKLADKGFRKDAREALTAYGDRIVETLRGFIVDPAVDLAVRSNICRVLSDIPTQHSVDTLVETLEHAEPEVKYYIIKALNRMRARYPELAFSHEALNSALIEETESYYTILHILQIEKRDDDAGRLLERALGEKIAQNLERIFRLLGLRYSQKDIYSAYLGIVGEKKDLRAHAIEFLDNVLKKEVKKYLFPIVDNRDVDRKVRDGRELFGFEVPDRNAALKYLIEGRDPWLKACALFTLRRDASDASEVSRELLALARQSLSDPYPVVRETARMVVG